MTLTYTLMERFLLVERIENHTFDSPVPKKLENESSINWQMVTFLTNLSSMMIMHADVP